MNGGSPLENEDWGRITAQLTAFAYKRIRGRSWEHAQDLAHDAIAAELTDSDTSKRSDVPLLKRLALRVMSLAANDWRRKRTTFEVLMENEEMEETADTESSRPDEAMERHEYAQAFRTRLDELLSGDEVALAVVECMLDGTDSVPDQSKATGFLVTQVRAARRRIFYHSEKVTAELSRELEEQEVAQ